MIALSAADISEDPDETGAELLQSAASLLRGSASGTAEAELQDRLQEARVLLRRAAHLCRYHQPGLQREIEAFLALVSEG